MRSFWRDETRFCYACGLQPYYSIQANISVDFGVPFSNRMLSPLFHNVEMIVPSAFGEGNAFRGRSNGLARWVSFCCFLMASCEGTHDEQSKRVDVAFL
jgi:hypothetical protein